VNKRKMRIHVLKFNRCDTTMRLADEFSDFDEYADFVGGIQDSKLN
jgi:hypothetical protein